MSIDTDVLEAIGSVSGTTPAAASAIPSGGSSSADSEPLDPDVILRDTGIDRQPAARPAPAAAKPGAPATKEGETEPDDGIDPLDPKLYQNLRTPEDFDKATKRILSELSKVNDLKRAAHRSHGAAERREKKAEAREDAVGQREAAAAAYDRAFQANVADLESGDPDRTLTGLHRLTKVGDPAGYWRTLMLKLASGGTFTPQEQKQAQADPEIQRRLSMIEQAVAGREQSEFDQQLEQAKTNNLLAARQNAATPRVVAYASDPRTADAIRDELAKMMVDHHKRTGRPLTVAQACASLESDLAVHYELSQRANGHTNGENGTTGLGPDAGRETSKDSPKPDGKLSTIPTQLGSAPAVATRPLSEREQREATVQGLERIGFFSRIGM